jgi:hypothetical protein
MNNSVFGKTCENQKKLTNIKLVNDKKKFEELCRKPELMDVRIFEDNKDLSAVELQKLQINITKPNYVGFVILELAKLHMYRYVIIFFSN